MRTIETRLAKTLAALAVTTLGLGGCFNPPQPECGLRCTTGVCPSGYTCQSDHFCHLNGSTGGQCAYPGDMLPPNMEAGIDASLEAGVDMAKADAPPDMAAADMKADMGVRDMATPDMRLDMAKPDMAKPDMKADMTPADTAKAIDMIPADTAKAIDMTPLDTTAYTLTVNGSGTGTITSSVGGISCTIAAGVASGTCMASVPTGTMVSLTAAGATGASTFGTWSGACSGTTATCGPLTVTSATSASAAFLSALSFDGNGSVSVATPTSALTPAGSFTLEATANLTATTAASTHVALVSYGDPFAASSPTGYQLGYNWNGTTTTFTAEFAVAAAPAPAAGSDASPTAALVTCIGTLATGARTLTGTYDATTGTLVLYDGMTTVCTATLAGATSSNPVAAPTGIFALGAPSTAAAADSSVAFTGVLDDVALSNGVIYTGATAPPRHPGNVIGTTLGLWPMDEGSGIHASDVANGNDAYMATGTTHVAWTLEP